MPFEERIKSAISALHAGRPVIILDDSSRENEGDLVYPAECIKPDIMSMMIRYGSGIVCLSLTEDYIERLNLPLMVDCNTSQNKTAFTVSIEAKTGVTTGVSAHDRVQTILTAMADDAKAEDLARPGHIFPLRAQAKGVLSRPGHTEASVDLMKLAGFKTAAVICELMNDDGSMAKVPDLEKFSETHAVPMLSVEDIINYRLCHEILVQEVASSVIQLDKHGEFSIKIFADHIVQGEHTVLIRPWKAGTTPLVRIHSSCMTGDVFGSLQCDCGKQLDYSLGEISAQGGVLLYLNQEGRGIGLTNKIKAYALQAEGRDTVEANLDLGLPEDNRHYYFAAHILKALELDKIRLLTNNPRKVAELAYYGIKEVGRIAMPTFANPHNERYLKTKHTKLHHLMTLLGPSVVSF